MSRAEGIRSASLVVRSAHSFRRGQAWLSCQARSHIRVSLSLLARFFLRLRFDLRLLRRAGGFSALSRDPNSIRAARRLSLRIFLGGGGGGGLPPRLSPAI